MASQNGFVKNKIYSVYSCMCARAFAHVCVITFSDSFISWAYTHAYVNIYILFCINRFMYIDTHIYGVWT